jgi:hypothetical protein
MLRNGIALLNLELVVIRPRAMELITSRRDTISACVESDQIIQIADIDPWSRTKTTRL